MSYLPAFPNALSWRILVVCGLLDVILAQSLGFTVTSTLMPPLGMITLMTILSHYLTMEKPHPVTARIARHFSIAEPNIVLARAAGLIAFVSATGMVLGPLGYFTAGLGLPLWDEAFASVDMLVFFDWRAFHAFVASNKPLADAFQVIYATTGYQFATVVIVLALTRNVARLSAFVTAHTLAAALCIVLGGLLPAAGAYTYWDIAASEHGFLTTPFGTGYLHDFNALRDGSLRTIDQTHLQGVVQFPSYHTIAAVLCGWALIGTRWIGIPFATMSGLIVLTTLPVGGHHLADVIAGAGLAWLGIVVAQRMEASAACPRPLAAMEQTPIGHGPEVAQGA